LEQAKIVNYFEVFFSLYFNPLNAELNSICQLLALLGAHHIFHVSGLRVNVLHISTVTHYTNSHVTEGKPKQVTGSYSGLSTLLTEV